MFMCMAVSSLRTLLFACTLVKAVAENSSLFFNESLSVSAGNIKMQNPFMLAQYSGGVYINPQFASSIDGMMRNELVQGDEGGSLSVLQSVPTAIWIDSASKIPVAEAVLADAAKHAENGGSAPLVVFVLYDLPNRDCNAAASLGEICCYHFEDGSCDTDNEGDCEEGLTRYRESVVQPFAAAIGKHDGQVPVVVVVEPDSIANLITNKEVPSCAGATRTAYTKGLQFALTHLREVAPAVTLYLDAGHGGWLGWDDKAQELLALVCELQLASLLRGFSTNVANYNPLGLPCPAEAFEGEGGNAAHYCHWVSTSDKCCNPDNLCSQELLEGYNSGSTELIYAQTLAKYARSECAELDFRPFMLIDTSRNGFPSARDGSCEAWCNVRGARVGELPTALTDLDIVDAFFWVKTPGESDGCSETLPNGELCPRFDKTCGSQNSLGSREGESSAPEAGEWYSWQMLELVQNLSDASGGSADMRLPGKEPSLETQQFAQAVMMQMRKEARSARQDGPRDAGGGRLDFSSVSSGSVSGSAGRYGTEPPGSASLTMWVFAWSFFVVGLLLSIYMLLPKSAKWKLGLRAHLPKLAPAPRRQSYETAPGDDAAVDCEESLVDNESASLPTTPRAEHSDTFKQERLCRGPAYTMDSYSRDTAAFGFKAKKAARPHLGLD